MYEVIKNKCLSVCANNVYCIFFLVLCCQYVGWGLHIHILFIYLFIFRCIIYRVLTVFTPVTSNLKLNILITAYLCIDCDRPSSVYFEWHALIAPFSLQLVPSTSQGRFS